MTKAKCSALTVNCVRCMNTFLAICRHCNTDFCIEHLQQHYQEMEKARLQFQLLIDEMMKKKSQLESLEPPSQYEENRRSLHQQLDRWIIKIRQLIDTSNDDWNQQKARLITEANDMLAVYENKHIDGTSDLDLLRKQLWHLNESIQRLTQVPTLLPTLMQMIDQIENHELAQNNDHDENKNEKQFPKKDECIGNDDNHEIEQQHTDEEQQSDDEQTSTEDDFDIDDIDEDNKEESESQSTIPIADIKAFKCNSCPLTTETAYGINQAHQVKNLPCRTQQRSIKFGLYSHLRLQHELCSNASIKIVCSVIQDDSNDLQTASKTDLFRPEEKIVSPPPSAFESECPLIAYGVYGILDTHKIRLCDGGEYALMNHFITFHNLRRSSATKLIKAMMNKTNSNQKLFKADELIDEQTIACPLTQKNLKLFGIHQSISGTPCSSVMKKFGLRQHLRKYHNLHALATRKILDAHERNQKHVLFERDENIIQRSRTSASSKPKKFKHYRRKQAYIHT